MDGYRETIGISPFIARIKGLIPTAQSWRLAATNAALSAERALISPNPNGDDLDALSLVSYLFKFTNKGIASSEVYNVDVTPGIINSTARSSIIKIKKTFMDMQNFLNAIHADMINLSEIHSPLPTHLRNEFAHAFTGSWLNRKSETDGIWFVTDNVKNKNDDFLINLIIHESCHAVGIGHAQVAGGAAYGNLALKLSVQDSLNNASSYTWLAHQARKPKSQWLIFR
jgi:hypothetical protein